MSTSPTTGEGLRPRATARNGRRRGLRGWAAGRRRALAIVLAAVLVVAVTGAVLVPRLLRHTVYDDLYNGKLTAADYWTTDPQILSAGLGFTGIIGLAKLDQESVKAAGGAWATTLNCAVGVTPADQQHTSAVLSSAVETGYVLAPGATVDHADGLPIVFSWPVRTDTIDPAQYRITLSSGRVVYPEAAGIAPNWELDERNTVVVFGHFGNRLAYGEPGAEYPIRLDIVDTDTPLTLAGPDGDRPAVGLFATSDHSGYGKGPTLVGAKLTPVDPTRAGENGVTAAGSADQPNDETSLYGSAAKFRLRMLTSGGFTPDGVRGLRPTDYGSYFRIRARGVDGSIVVLNKTGADYKVKGGTLRVLGLSDLGRKAGGDIAYDDCYSEDRDNVVDIVLSGDAAAARNLTAVEMPGVPGGYRALYNPGGPGPNPFPGVRYTIASPPIVQSVTIALDTPMRVTR
jgi:hypothetical protein